MFFLALKWGLNQGSVVLPSKKVVQASNIDFYPHEIKIF